MELADDQTPSPGPRRGKNDWQALADGQWYVAVQGVDFDKASSFRQLPHQWAANTGARMEYQGRTYRAQTRTLPNGNVMFRIIPGPGGKQ